MGRHVNHHDEQDRWLNKATKINRNNRIEDRDPASLTLEEQFELAKLRRKEEKLKNEKLAKVREEELKRHNFSHYKPK
jgi:hypothetical protein